MKTAISFLGYALATFLLAFGPLTDEDDGVFYFVVLVLVSPFWLFLAAHYGKRVNSFVRGFVVGIVAVPATYGAFILLLRVIPR